jgi:hypothetical protein
VRSVFVLESAMPVELLTVLEWLGSDARHEEHSNPSWEQVEEAIQRLNGRERNDLFLYTGLDETPPGASLSVGGGDGRYVVVGMDRGASTPTFALGPDIDDGSRVELLVSGLPGYYRRHWIVDLDTALRAARSFYETGGFGGGGVQWGFASDRTRRGT